MHCYIQPPIQSPPSLTPPHPPAPRLWVFNFQGSGFALSMFLSPAGSSPIAVPLCTTWSSPIACSSPTTWSSPHSAGCSYSGGGPVCSYLAEGSSTGSGEVPPLPGLGPPATGLWASSACGGGFSCLPRLRPAPRWLLGVRSRSGLCTPRRADGFGVHCGVGVSPLPPAHVTALSALLGRCRPGG